MNDAVVHNSLGVFSRAVGFFKFIERYSLLKVAKKQETQNIAAGFLRPVYKERGLLLQAFTQAARVTRIGRLPYLCTRVTLARGFTSSVVKTPGRVNPPSQPPARVNFLIASRPFKVIPQK